MKVKEDKCQALSDSLMAVNISICNLFVAVLGY